MNGITGKTVLVTGASAGIGLATARALSEKGARLIVHGRNEEKAAAAAESVSASTGSVDVIPVFGDFSSLQQVRRLAEQVVQVTERLDVLIHNAGGIFYPRALSMDGYELMFAVNHLAPFLLTLRLKELLIRSAPARVIVVASMAHKRAWLDLDDLNSSRRFSAMPVYGGSKLSNIYFARSLARRLQAHNICVNSLHPGVVASSFGREGDAGKIMHHLMGLARFVLIGPDKGASTSVFLASDTRVENVTGKYFVRCKERATSNRALDDDFAEALWKLSEEMVGERWI